jgi:hypothetical protein
LQSEVYKLLKNDLHVSRFLLKIYIIKWKILNNSLISNKYIKEIYNISLFCIKTYFCFKTLMT